MSAELVASYDSSSQLTQAPYLRRVILGHPHPDTYREVVFGLRIADPETDEVRLNRILAVIRSYPTAHLPGQSESYVVEHLHRAFSVFPEMSDRLSLATSALFGLHYMGGQLRKSGEPAFTHSIRVADILLEFRDEINSLPNLRNNGGVVDADLLRAGYKHDLPEDTDLTEAEVREYFEDSFANEISALTEDEPLRTNSIHGVVRYKHAVGLMLSGGVRAVLVKLADRLHNMRTLHHVNDVSKREAKAVETFWVHEQISYILGLQKMYMEFRFLTHKYLPHEYVARRFIESSPLSKDERTFQEQLVQSFGRFAFVA